jgi:hypothetical protein
LFPPGLEYIAAFFGCIYAGVSAVPLYPPTRNHFQPRLLAVAADAQATGALTTGALLSHVDQWLGAAPDLQQLRWIAADSLDASAREWTPPAIDGDTIAFLQYTSGSTARPRGEFDLTLTAAEIAGTLRLSFQYNTGLFDEATIARMADHLHMLIDGICADPEQPVGLLPLLRPAERRQALQRSVTTERAVADRCIHQLIQAQAQRTPAQTAIVHDGATLSYELLDRRSNQWARVLQQLGAGPAPPPQRFPRPADGSLLRALATAACVSADASDRETLAYIVHALRMLPIDLTATAYNEHERASLPPDRYEEHDEFFGVVRVEGHPLDVFLHSILNADAFALEDTIAAGATLDARAWKRLRSAFEAVLTYMRVHSAEPDLSCVEPPAPLVIVERELDPLRRWRVGHQVFFVQIQSLIVAFNCFREALQTEQIQDAGAALDLATALMWGSASALRFAGAFGGESYEDVVRPAMMPPHLERGFSGLQMRDHRYLLHILKELRPTFQDLDPRLKPQHQHFMQAFELAYEAHKFVCGRFRGDEEPSLRMPPTSTKSSVDVLDDLKSSRIRAVGD